MLYYYNLGEVKGAAIEKKVMVLYHDGEKSYTTQQVLSDSFLFDKVKSKYNAKVAVMRNVPLIFVNPTVDASAIDPFWQLISKDFTETFDTQIAANWISKLSTKVDVNTLKILIPGIASQALWENGGELDASISFGPNDIDMDFMQETSAYFNARVQSAVQVFKSINYSENVTKYQADPTDDFFIEIPLASAVQSCDNPLTLIPDRNMVFKPYANPAYATKRYKELGTISNGDLAKIEGQATNNTFEIYENEKKFHSALNEWIDYNINSAFPSGDGSILDNTSLAFLEALISELYCWNWSHVATVPDEISVLRNQENPEDIEYEYEFTHTDNVRFNSVTLLLTYINEVYITTKDPHVYTDAIIQLARWGSRKPTEIIFRGYETKFVLGEGMCASHVDLSTYSLKIFEDGADNDFEGFIEDDLVYRDTTINGSKSWSTPLGFVTSRVYEPADGISPVQIRYDIHSFIEAIPLIKSGKLKIHGISFNDGVWNVDTCSDVPYKVSEIARVLTDTKLKNDFSVHRCQETEDKCISLQIPASGIITNEVTSFFEVASYTNLREIVDSFNVTDIASFRTFIMKYKCSASATMSIFVLTKLIHLLEYLEKDCADSSISVFERWDTAMNAKPSEQSIKNVTSFTAEEKAITVNESQVTVPSNNSVQKPVQSVTQTATQPQGVSSWIQQIPSNATIYPVVDDKGTVVCYSALSTKYLPKLSKPFKLYLLLSKPGDRPVDEAHHIPINKIVANIMHTLYLEKVEGSSLRQVYLGDGEVLKTLRDYFITLK